jgi:hypothetical protein
MRSINLGVIVKQQPTTTITVVLPEADATATAMVSTGASTSCAAIPPSYGDRSTRFVVNLPPGQYALFVDSTVRPGQAGSFSITASAETTFWSVAHPDPQTTPRPWQLSTGTAVTLDDPKDPWPKPAALPMPGVAANDAVQTSQMAKVMSNLLDSDSGRGADPTKRAHTVHALLIGIDYYPPGSGSDGAHYSELRGCVNDILEVEQLLKSKLGELAVTRLLAPRPDGAQRDLAIAPHEVPTYDNIVAAWRRVIEAAGPDDLVYIHYSGHGGRAKTLFSEIKASGVDESLVPCDINQQHHYLRDVEMAVLLQRLVDRDIKTVVVLDSCHSGSFTRGDQARLRTRADGLVDLAPRHGDARASAVASFDELARMARKLETDTTGLTWKLAPGGRLTSPLTVIAACAPTEGAYEYAPDHGTVCGALTYHWRHALAQVRPGAGVTYRQVFAQVLAGVQSVFLQQTPVLLGEPDRLVFGMDVLATRPALQVREVHHDQISLDGGAALHLDVGATLAIVPPDQLPELVELAELPAVEVISLSGFSARARRIPGTGRPDAVIAVGSRAVMRSYSVCMQRKVRIAAPPPFADALASQIAADRAGLLAITTADDADLQVLLSAEAEVAEIADASGAVFPKVPFASLSAADAAETTARQLLHLARYSNLRAFVNRDPHAPLAGLLDAGLHKLGIADAEAAGVLHVMEDEQFEIRITNRSSAPLTYYLLNLRPDWSVALLDPDGGILGPGQTAHRYLRGALPDAVDTHCRDVIMVLATRTAVDAPLLTLEPLGAPRLPRGLRRAQESALESLMRVLQDPTGEAIRHARLDETPSSGWFVVQTEFETRRAPRP